MPSGLARSSKALAEAMAATAACVAVFFKKSLLDISDIPLLCYFYEIVVTVPIRVVRRQPVDRYEERCQERKCELKMPPRKSVHKNSLLRRLGYTGFYIKWGTSQTNSLSAVVASGSPVIQVSLKR